MPNFTTSIIIPNYNGRKLLEKNLPAVLEAARSAAEIIVVDDCSQDDSIDFLQKNYPQVKIIKTEKNKGYASTVNSGVSKVTGDIAVLLNSDIVPERDFLKPIIDDFSRDENLFAIGCLDKSYEGGQITERGKGILYYQKGLFVHRAGDMSDDDLHTDWVSGGSSAYRRDIWLRLGGMDEKFNPFYYEDIDLSYRAVKAGYKIILEKRSITNHYHEEGAVIKNFSAAKTQEIAFRNQLYFSWKHGNHFKMLLWLPYYFLTGTIKNKNLSFVKGIFRFLFINT